MDSPIDRYQRLADYYDIFIDWEPRLARELPFLLAVAPPGKLRRALDLGCGSGKHLERLGQEGFAVEGSEPSPALREQARKLLGASRVHAAPLEELAGLAEEHGPWELVLCLGNTLAHLPADRLDRFAADLERSLAPAGVAVLHLLNYEKIMERQPAGLPPKLVEHQGRRWRFEREYRYREDRIEFTVKVFRDDEPLAEDRELLYPLTEPQLRRAAARAGFGRIGCYGGFSRETPFTSDSDNLVMVMHKG